MTRDKRDNLIQLDLPHHFGHNFQIVVPLTHEGGPPTTQGKAWIQRCVRMAALVNGRVP